MSKMDEVEEIFREFANGTPVSQEVYFEDGTITFHFDNPFEEDVDEPFVIASLLVNTDENSFPELTSESVEFEDIERLEDLNSELLSTVEPYVETIYNPEPDPSNDTDSYKTYTYTIFF